MQNESRKLGQSESRVEPKGMTGLQTSMGIIENGLTNFTRPKDGLLEFILSPANLNAAYKKVKSNKGSGGIDGMSTEGLLPYLREHGPELVASLREGTYKPNPVRRVEIPKANGKKRGLGIPTVVDRVVQQAISQVLEVLYEPQFSETSYGFRPHRGAHKALLKCGEYIEQGYVFTVDMDLEKFFDTVSHSKLIEVLSRTVKDGRVVSLIHRYLNAGVINRGKYEPSRLGVPQGGPLSPMLSNIMLNELDKELERRGHKFVRYADDLVILCKSRKAAQRTYEHITPFIENKLFLRVNKEKTKVAYMRDIKFLSYAFGRRNGKCQYRLHPESIKKMKSKIRELTSRSNGWSYEYRKQRLTWYIRGWSNYFSLAGYKRGVEEWDSWLRHRIRMCIWKSWKKPRTRVKNLIKCGIDKWRAYQWGNTCKGYWRIADSWILARAIGDEALRKAGYSWIGCYYSASALPKG